jgi:hypothetical protein
MTVTKNPLMVPNDDETVPNNKNTFLIKTVEDETLFQSTK